MGLIESNPADESPLSDEWLKEAGFTWNEKGAYWTARRGRLGVWVRTSGAWGAWIEATMGGGFSSYRHLKNCGELRLICFLLGVEIAATTASVRLPPPVDCSKEELLRQNGILRTQLREISQRWILMSVQKLEKRFTVEVHTSEEQQRLDWEVAAVEDVLAALGG